MPYNGKIEPGTIILYAQYKPTIFTFKYRVVFGALQKFFTRKKWTHTAMGFFPIKGHEDVETLFESNEIQNITLWNPKDISEYEIYKIIFYSKSEIETALWKTFLEYNGELYGFIQLLYFVRRWFWETKWIKKLFWFIPTKIFGKPNDIRQWNNWFVGGTICSELFYNFMDNLNKIKYHAGVQKMLNTWNKNNFHSGDSYDFIKALPDVFELVYHKPGGVLE